MPHVLAIYQGISRVFTIITNNASFAFPPVKRSQALVFSHLLISSRVFFGRHRAGFHAAEAPPLRAICECARALMGDLSRA